jgi:hypothetical protein
MKSKSLIIASIWTFVLTTIAIQYLEGFGMSFFGYILLFSIALTSSAAIEFLTPKIIEQETDLRSEIHYIKSKLDKLTGESV